MIGVILGSLLARQGCSWPVIILVAVVFDILSLSRDYIAERTEYPEMILDIAAPHSLESSTDG